MPFPVGRSLESIRSSSPPGTPRACLGRQQRDVTGADSDRRLVSIPDSSGGTPTLFPHEGFRWWLFQVLAQRALRFESCFGSAVSDKTVFCYPFTAPPLDSILRSCVAGMEPLGGMLVTHRAGGFSIKQRLFLVQQHIFTGGASSKAQNKCPGRSREPLCGGDRH